MIATLICTAIAESQNRVSKLEAAVRVVAGTNEEKNARKELEEEIMNLQRLRQALWAV